MLNLRLQYIVSTLFLIAFRTEVKSHTVLYEP